jgi:hypothetical protein
MVEEEEEEGRGRGLICGTVPAFAWKDYGISRTTSFRIVRVPVEMRTSRIQARSDTA